MKLIILVTLLCLIASTQAHSYLDIKSCTKQKYCQGQSSCSLSIPEKCDTNETVKSDRNCQFTFRFTRRMIRLVREKTEKKNGYYTPEEMNQIFQEHPISGEIKAKIDQFLIDYQTKHAAFQTDNSKEYDLKQVLLYFQQNLTLAFLQDEIKEEYLQSFQKCDELCASVVSNENSKRYYQIQAQCDLPTQKQEQQEGISYYDVETCTKNQFCRGQEECNTKPTQSCNKSIQLIKDSQECSEFVDYFKNIRQQIYTITSRNGYYTPEEMKNIFDQHNTSGEVKQQIEEFIQEYKQGYENFVNDNSKEQELKTILKSLFDNLYQAFLQDNFPSDKVSAFQQCHELCSDVVTDEESKQIFEVKAACFESSEPVIVKEKSMEDIYTCAKESLCDGESECTVEINERCSMQSEPMKSNRSCQFLSGYSRKQIREIYQVIKRQGYHTPQEMNDIFAQHKNLKGETKSSIETYLANYNSSYQVYQSDNSKDQELNTLKRSLSYYVRLAFFSDVLREEFIPLFQQCFELCSQQVQNERSKQYYQASAICAEI